MSFALGIGHKQTRHGTASNKKLTDEFDKKKNLRHCFFILADGLFGLLSHILYCYSYLPNIIYVICEYKWRPVESNEWA